MIDRRNFINRLIQIGAGSSLLPVLLNCRNKKQINDISDEYINKIELFRYDINITRHFSWGTWYNRQHLFMKISAGDYYGWSEIPASKNNPDFDPTSWQVYLSIFKGLSIAEAFKALHSKQRAGSKYSTKQLEFVEMGLLDLAGRILQKPAVEILNLKARQAIPGLYCILDNNLARIKRKARRSIEQDLASHMKIKMFNDIDLNIKILNLVRDILGSDAMVMSDPNRGLKSWRDLNELAQLLKNFHKNGLDAIEDPAELNIDQWIRLQTMVGELALIPDFPLRPAWLSLEKLKKGMGKIYNLHPSTMGSFSHTAKLAHKIKSMGARVMIGDDSLAGPACSAWQQIAIGAGAIWVEAIEKRGDSDKYLECLESKPTYRNRNGQFTMDLRPGFGVEIDTEKLRNSCKVNITI